MTVVVASLFVTAPSAREVTTGVVLVANQQSASASLIDLASGTATVIPVGAGPHEAVVSPSGRTGIVTIYGISGQPGNGLAVIDIAAKKVTKTISLGEYTRPHGAMFLPGDESRAVVTSEATQRLLVVNLASGQVEHAIATGAAGSHMVALSADGTRAATSNITGGSTSVFDLSKPESPALVIPTAPQTEGIAITPDGKFVWAATNTGAVNIVDVATKVIVKTLDGFGQPYRLAMSKDGRTALICDPRNDAVHVADVAERKVLWSLTGIGAPRGVNIAPDGSTAFVTLAASESVGVIDLAQRKIVRTFPVEKSPDGVWYGPSVRR